MRDYAQDVTQMSKSLLYHEKEVVLFNTNKSLKLLLSRLRWSLVFVVGLLSFSSVFDFHALDVYFLTMMIKFLRPHLCLPSTVVVVSFWCVLFPGRRFLIKNFYNSLEREGEWTRQYTIPVRSSWQTMLSEVGWSHKGNESPRDDFKARQPKRELFFVK